MLDEKTLRKRVFLRLLGSPITVAPFMIGMTVMTASWALDWNPGVGLFAALAGALTAGGAFVTRLVLGGERMVREIAGLIEKEEQEARQRSLDQLDDRLSTADQDPRPETALRDLRALVNAFDETSLDSFPLHASTYVDIRARVGQLFDHCVESLQQTDRLWQTSQRLQTAAARNPILAQREKVIDEIQSSIKQLSDTMVALQTLGAGPGSNAELARLRDELDQSLAMAKTVEERVNDLVKGSSDPRVQDKPQK